MKWSFRNIFFLLSIMGLSFEVFSADVQEPVSFKPYGFIKLGAVYDSNRTNGGDLSYYTYPEAAGEKDDELTMTAKETRIGIDLSGPDVPDITTTGKIEGDFCGGGTANNSNPRMRLAYINLDFGNGFSVRTGQDWFLFNPILPKMSDGAILGDAGFIWGRVPQIRLSHDAEVGNLKILSKIAVIRTIGQDLDGGGLDDGTDTGTPAYQANLGFEFPLLTEKATKFNIGGHFGTETVDTVTGGVITENDATEYDTWSVTGSFFFPIVDKFALQGGGFTGENLDAYLGGIGQGVNKTLETEIESRGFWIEALIYITSDFNVNAGYGMDKPEKDDLNTNDRSENSRIFGNMFYKLTPAVTMDFEYSRMETSYKGNSEATNDRFQIGTVYKF